MFEFLFSNPIILIILIGVISSLLKKKNNSNQQKSNRPQESKPIWQEVIREVKEEWLEEKKQIPKTIQEAKSVLPPAEEEVDRKRIAELKRLEKEYEESQKYTEVKSNPHTATVFPTPKSKAIHAASINTISDNDSPIYNKEMTFGKQEIVNGIIMSEILGPPRSKRGLKR